MEDKKFHRQERQDFRTENPKSPFLRHLPLRLGGFVRVTLQFVSPPGCGWLGLLLQAGDPIAVSEWEMKIFSRKGAEPQRKKGPTALSFIRVDSRAFAVGSAGWVLRPR